MEECTNCNNLYEDMADLEYEISTLKEELVEANEIITEFEDQLSRIVYALDDLSYKVGQRTVD